MKHSAYRLLQCGNDRLVGLQQTSAHLILQLRGKFGRGLPPEAQHHEGLIEIAQHELRVGNVFSEKHV